MGGNIPIQLIEVMCDLQASGSCFDNCCMYAVGDRADNIMFPIIMLFSIKILCRTNRVNQIFFNCNSFIYKMRVLHSVTSSF